MEYHLIYTSTAAREMSNADLQALLQQAREKNARLHITGILIHRGGHFIQLLEGEQQAVMSLYRSIEQDRRHSGYIVIEQGPIAARSFSGWAMDYRHPKLNDVLFTEAELAADDTGTLTLLADFVKNMR